MVLLVELKLYSCQFNTDLLLFKGTFLSTPVTDVETESGGNDRYHFAVSSMQGWRSGSDPIQIPNNGDP